MAADELAEIDVALAAIGKEHRRRFAAASNEVELRQVRAEFLGKKGTLTRALKSLGAIAADKRRQAGERVNQLREEVENAFEVRLRELTRAERDRDLAAFPYDLTLPGRSPSPRGHRHPVLRALDEILDIFRSLGFEVAWGPEVELEENNFSKLAFPPDHPATDMQDTFWVDVDGAAGTARPLLRTHTSTVQIREMTSRTPPMAIVSGGPVYRRDDDVTHSPMFHQVEGFIVSENVNFAHLKGVLTAFAHRLYGRRPVRYRPSYFPFVEPGAELDVACAFCDDSGPSRAQCRVCKATGWVEILGCGLIHPKVLSNCGVDPEQFSGFAFGLGVERVAMLRHGIPDIRLLFENDPRFLSQF